jgi:hypothetical protein
MHRSPAVQPNITLKGSLLIRCPNAQEAIHRMLVKRGNGKILLLHP